MISGGTKYVVAGFSLDRRIPVGVVGRFVEGGRFLIITVYEIEREFPMYGYKCEYCSGTVRPKKVAMEGFKHKERFILLEDVTIGVCDTCGNRYYTADILHAVHELATGERAPERTAEVPVAHMT